MKVFSVIFFSNGNCTLQGDAGKLVVVCCTLRDVMVCVIRSSTTDSCTLGIVVGWITGIGFTVGGSNGGKVRMGKQDFLHCDSINALFSVHNSPFHPHITEKGESWWILYDSKDVSGRFCYVIFYCFFWKFDCCGKEL